MLNQIHIQNFVIVDELRLDFHTGFNVLTGETGAGKSIWVDAVMLALGSRADSNVVREGADQCSISLCFDLKGNQSATQWLEQHDLQSDDECIIRRIIKKDGKSKSTVNGIPCSQSMIKALCPKVLLTQSQHQHQALTKTSRQRRQLDIFAQSLPLVEQCENFCKDWQSLQTQIDHLRCKIPNKEDELALWQYQLDEIKQLNYQPNEWQSLCDEHQQCHNAAEFMQHINSALQVLSASDTPNARDYLQQAVTHLNQTDQDNTTIKEATELLNTADIHLEEAEQSLQNFKNQMDLSPERLAYLDKRIQTMHDIARKHQCQPNEIDSLKTQIQNKIDTLKNLDDKLNQLQQQADQLQQQYQTVAKKLSSKRVKAAKTLSQTITQMIQPLGMQSAQFKIDLSTDLQQITPHGQDHIDFLVSTNAGQKLQPMSKTASGGELSRISLSLQVAIAGKCHPPTLIFDEVDAGIGGRTADTVGDLLQQLGQKNQILCITHLAQIAAKGCQHFNISKSVKDNQTFSTMKVLTDKQRIDEIARMLGSDDQSSKALAKKMLKSKKTALAHQ